ncbi:immunoglobulin-like domain-containing protein [Oligoflexus tunisiensis]|uniref:immunoglobulin-like domain-containing protein n=1 Tax=Oligoflexus tunisiensis TaxID=708132 RepID=UPI00114C9D19|nr:immunoglobulin-like domain-containing protein [Oligoflexus tunisiensis]
MNENLGIYKNSGRVKIFGAIVLLCFFMGMSESCKKKSKSVETTDSLNEEVLLREKDGLTERDFSFAPCDTASRVTKNFSLLTKTNEETSIHWASSNPEIITISNGAAEVIQSANIENVVLTAKLTRGSATATKEFTIVVVPRSESDVSNDDGVYFVGYSNNTSNTPVGGYWKAGTWSGNELLATSPDDTVNVSSVVMLGNDVYSGGHISDSNFKVTAGYWKNGGRTALESPVGSQQPRFISMASSGTDIYTLIYNEMEAGYWKADQWFRLSSDQAFTKVTSLTLDGNDVYVTGNRKIRESTYAGGYWKNGTWNELTSPAAVPPGSWAESIYLYNDDIYIPGSFDWHGGYWKNGEWTNLPAPLGLENYISNSWQVIISDSDIFALGYLQEFYVRPFGSDPKRFGYWKNRTWTELNHFVHTIAIFGCDLYAVGHTINSSNNKLPGYSKNGVWTSLPPLDASKDGEVTSIKIDQQLR